MDGQQHTYEIIINKDGLLIELSSDDVYFISKQMDKWFRILMDDSYVPVSMPVAPVQPVLPPVQAELPQLPPVAVAPPPVLPPPPVPVAQQQNDMSQVHLPHEMPPVAPPLPTQPQQQVQPQYQVQPVPLPVAPVPSLSPQPMAPVENLPQPVQNLPQPQVQPAAQPIPLPVENPMPPAPQPVEPVQRTLLVPESQVQPQQQAMAPLPQAQTVPQQQEPVSVAEAPEYFLPEPEVPEEPKDDFERVMDTLMEDLGEGDSQALPQPLPKAVPGVEPLTSQGNEGKPEDDSISSLADLCKKGAANTSEDFMLLAAYYLTYFEAVENFSLKKLNSSMVKSGLTPVNHSVLETALSKGLLSMVPDLTGTMDVTEYALSDEGQQYVSHLL